MPASLRNTLNARQEAFCRGVAEGKSQSQAYVDAGYAARGNSAEANAAILIRNHKVAARLAERQAENAARSRITVDTIIRELNEARELAKRINNPSAMVSASMAKAKLCGLAVDRSVVTMKHNYAMMSEAELRDEIAALNAEARALKAGVRH